MTKPKPATPTVRTCERCGHVGRYGTITIADHHFPRHSCELVTLRRDRKARRLARLAEGGPERPCTCKRAQHQHGDRARYVIDRCRCRSCREAQRVYERARARQVAYGRARHVDGEQARLHVRALMAQGMGKDRIADTAGVARSVVAKLLYGRGSRGQTAPRAVRPVTKKLERGVAAKLLAVELDLAPGARVPVVGTSRRLQALVTIGWSQAKLAARLHTTPSQLTGLVHGTRKPTLATVRAVSALYEELWDQQPPQDGHRDRVAYSRSVNYARSHGWAPPMAWDDDTIDLPDSQPAHQLQDAADDRPRARRGLASTVLVDEVEFLAGQGLTRDEIATQLGVTVSAIFIALDRAGRRHDLWQRLLDRDQASGRAAA